jgi:hypothetical protein
MSGRHIPRLADDIDLLGAALTLIKHGIYVLPVEPDSKRPAKILGFNWQSQSSIDPEQIIEWFTGTPYLLAIHVGRSGFVVFDVDEYDNLPIILIQEFNSNPGPWQSTREEGLRGHRIYEQPEGRNFGNSLGRLKPGKDSPSWGEIRGANGIIVVEPSHHTKAGGRYKWLEPGEVPVLSQNVANLLDDVNMDEANVRVATDAEVRLFFDKHIDNLNPQFLQPVVDAFGNESARGSRHDALVRNLVWAMRDSKMGDFPAREAAMRIRELFLIVMGEERGRFPKSEFMGALGFAIAQANLDDTEARKIERAARLRRRDQENGWSKRSVTQKDIVELRDPYDPQGTPPTIISLPPTEDVEDRDDFRTGARNKEGIVRINVADKASAIEWLREEIGRGQLSGLFYRGNNLVYTPLIGEQGYVEPRQEGADDGPAQVRMVSSDGLTSMIETRYDIGRVEVKKDKEDKVTGKQWRRTLLPRELATRCVGSTEVGDTPHLRPLYAITHTPVMRPDGSIFDKPGYDLTTQMLFLPTGNMGKITVPEAPTREQVEVAKATILYPVNEFPFVSKDDLANWVGAAFTPLLRPLVPPPYQFLIIEAPSPGSGKGYLLGVLREAHGVALRPGMPVRDEEMSKVVMTMLSGTTAPIVAFDNVRGVVHSSVLEGLLTARTVSDRTLGKNNEYMEVPNDRLWAMTGNNAQIGGDLARRTLRVTIDPRVPNPEARTGFKCHPILWTQEHRGEYISALLTIARAWIVAGRPVAPAGRSDDYAVWVQTIRGIMNFAGFEGTFSNSESRKERSAEDDEWATFLEAIVDSFNTGVEFTAKELHAQILDASATKPNGTPIDPMMLPGDLTEKFGSWHDSSKFIKSLGLWLRNRVGRYAGDLKVVDCGKGTSGARKNVQVYRIERAGEVAQDTEVKIRIGSY